MEKELEFERKMSQITQKNLKDAETEKDKALEEKDLEQKKAEDAFNTLI